MKRFKSVNESLVGSKSSPLRQLHNLSPKTFAKRNVNKDKHLKQLKTQFQTLHRDFDKLTSKYDKAVGVLNSSRRRNTSLEKELISNRTIVDRLAEEKLRLEEELAQSKEYIRRLEFTITTESKGRIYSQTHNKISKEMDEQSNKINTLKKDIKELRNIIKEKDNEISNLKEALNVNASELKVKGGILHELGTTRNKLQQQSMEFIKIIEDASRMRRMVFINIRRIVGRGEGKE